MANRYWVGGAGTWDLSATTHWSSTSGGVSGATIPTLTDDVYFDGNSGTGRTTLSNPGALTCRSLICSGFTGDLYHVSNAAINILNIYGDLILCSTMGASGFGSAVKLLATSGTYSIDFAGKITQFNSVTISGGATYNMLNDMQTANTGILTLQLGTLNTNNYSMLTSGSIATNGFAISGGIFNAGTSTIDVKGINITGGVLNTSGATLIVRGVAAASTPTFALNGSSWASVKLTNSVAQNVTIPLDSFTTPRLEFAMSGHNTVSLASNLTVATTFKISNSNSGDTLNIKSSVDGTRRTITSNGTNTCAYCSFNNITGSGSSSWNLSAISTIYDCGNNTGITFNAAIPSSLYWVGRSDSFPVGNGWSLTTGGGVSGLIPTRYINAVMDNNSSSSTITLSTNTICKTFDSNNFSGSFDGNSTINVYGSLYIGTGVTCGYSGVERRVLQLHKRKLSNHKQLFKLLSNLP